MFPYIQNEKPITSGNNDLKFIKIYSLKLIPSLSANVPAKITISIPKAIKIISSEDSIFNFLFENIVFFDLLISGVLVCSFFTNRMFPYIQNENPITSGNNDLKLIKIYSLKLIPSLNAKVPANITISIPKAIKIISLDDSIFNFLVQNIVSSQSTGKQELQTLFI